MYLATQQFQLKMASFLAAEYYTIYKIIHNPVKMHDTFFIDDEILATKTFLKVLEDGFSQFQSFSKQLRRDQGLGGGNQWLLTGLAIGYLLNDISN